MPLTGDSVTQSLQAKVILDQPLWNWVKETKHSLYIYIRITWPLKAYLRTYSIEQSSSWEANRSSASQEIPRILWNQQVRYRTHKSAPAVPALRQIDPVHASSPSHVSQIHFNITLPSKPGSFPQVSPPKPCTPVSFPPYVLRPLPISVFLICSHD